MTPVPRSRYLEELLAGFSLEEVKVLTGVRRCGKSTLLEMLGQALVADGMPRENVVSVRLDAYSVPVSPTAQWLMDQVDEGVAKANPDRPVLVTIDEPQEIPGWEEVVRRVRNRPRTSVYITGSNSQMLSVDLSTMLSGRYVEMPVRPLSFEEYLSFSKALGLPEQSVQDYLDDYLRYGGMPGLFQEPDIDNQSASRLLRGVFDTVILNDVVRRLGGADVDLLDRLVRYVFSTSGSLLSPGKIAATLTSGGRKTHQDTVDRYLSALCDALIVSECDQSGVGRELLRPRRKYYPVDLGLRNLPGGFTGADLGFRMECAVHNELAGRGWTVRVGTLRGGEIDFVAWRGDERAYYQVSASVRDEGVWQRELAPLNSLSDGFPRFLVTGDKARLGTTDRGIRVVRLQDWLLDR